jgi:DNA segregation ATPase FtsK/SpoIIIE-like protein
MITIGINRTFWEESGAQLPVQWDFKRLPHCLIVGATGSGKTYASALILGRVGLHIEDSSITLCDFKNDDFKHLDGAANYYGFMKCKDGIDKFFTEFQERQEGRDESRSFKLLYFDEWTSFINCLDKKEAESYKTKLATLLMLGRSYNVHVIVSVQRADAQNFNTARDNFNIIIALGNISRESRLMLFAGIEKEEMPPVEAIGAGYALINGAELIPLQIPTINNFDKLWDNVRAALNR